MKKEEIWLDIALKVSINPFVKILCPNCKRVYLNYLIIPWATEESKIDIHLICNDCNARNVITKSI